MHNYTKRTRVLAGAMAVILLFSLLSILSGCGKKTVDFTLPTRMLKQSQEILRFSSYTYEVYDDDTVILTGYDGGESKIVIPDKVNGMNVVALAPALFCENQGILTVRLGKYVESVGAQCFLGCTELYEVTFNSVLWYVGANAFAGTPWLNAQKDEFLVVGDGVLLRYSGEAATITIPENVKHLADAFYCNVTLTTVDIGDNVLTIGEQAFAYCSRLAEVKIGKNVRQIASYAFYNCTLLSSVVFPDTLERVGEFAYGQCMGITRLIFGKNTSRLSPYAFHFCTNLTYVYIPIALKEIPENVFGDCYAFSLIMYEGTEAQYAEINVDDTNFRMESAHVVYEASKGN